MTRWLLDAQCPDGGWAYDAPFAPGTDDQHCDDGSGNDFFTSDSNTTAYAVQALEEAGRTGWGDDPFDFFDTVRDPDHGGWAYSRAFLVTDANSTGLVLQAFVAGEQRSPRAVSGRCGACSTRAAERGRTRATATSRATRPRSNDRRDTRPLAHPVPARRTRLTAGPTDGGLLEPCAASEPRPRPHPGRSGPRAGHRGLGRRLRSRGTGRAACRPWWSAPGPRPRPTASPSTRPASAGSGSSSWRASSTGCSTGWGSVARPSVSCRRGRERRRLLRRVPGLLGLLARERFGRVELGRVGRGSASVEDGDMDGWVWGSGDSGATHPRRPPWPSTTCVRRRIRPHPPPHRLPVTEAAAARAAARRGSGGGGSPGGGSGSDGEAPTGPTGASGSPNPSPKAATDGNPTTNAPGTRAALPPSPLSTDRSSRRRRGRSSPRASP